MYSKEASQQLRSDSHCLTALISCVHINRWKSRRQCVIIYTGLNSSCHDCNSVFVFLSASFWEIRHQNRYDKRYKKKEVSQVQSRKQDANMYVQETISCQCLSMWTLIRDWIRIIKEGEGYKSGFTVIFLGNTWRNVASPRIYTWNILCTNIREHVWSFTWVFI